MSTTEIRTLKGEIRREKKSHKVLTTLFILVFVFSVFSIVASANATLLDFSANYFTGPNMQRTVFRDKENATSLKATSVSFVNADGMPLYNVTRPLSDFVRYQMQVKVFGRTVTNPSAVYDCSHNPSTSFVSPGETSAIQSLVRERGYHQAAMQFDRGDIANINAYMVYAISGKWSPDS